MSLIGYARVSSSGQSLDVQLEQLQEAGCEKVFAEKRSGTTTDGREQLELALGYVRDGDVLVVTRLDRLARSAGDLWKIVERLKGRGAGLRVLQQGLIDTTTPMGKVVLGVMAIFAELENDLRRERQLDGIAKAKAAGVYAGKGRKPSVDVAEVRRRHAAGERPADIAKAMKIGRASVYRALEEKPGADQQDAGA